MQMSRFAVSLATLVCGISMAANAHAQACSVMTLGPLGALNGFVPSADDAWHQDISKAPVDPNSDRLVMDGKTGLANSRLHPDFSIPYVVVDSATTPGVAVKWQTKWIKESDTTLFPIPANLPIEGNPKECPTGYDDRHALILDRHLCVDYEIYQAAHCDGGWIGSNGAVWDLTEAEKRPYTFTSVDAAGLSVFEGLLRYDEILAGEVNHAIRFTAKYTKNNNAGGLFTLPATHAAGNLWGSDVIMGMRIRLKADFDISNFSKTNQIILKGMKKYGMILADNGGTMFFQGTPDSRWDVEDLNALKAVAAESFEVLKMGPVYDEYHLPKGRKPSIKDFKASSTKVAAGAAVTLTAKIKDASYSVVDEGGFWRGPITVHPTVTTTYTLTSSNEFGQATASVKVEVQP